MRYLLLFLLLLASRGDATRTAAPCEVEEPAAPPVSADAGGTGSADCDVLITRVRCAHQAFDDEVRVWRELLLDDATRQATINACKMALDAADHDDRYEGC